MCGVVTSLGSASAFILLTSLLVSGADDVSVTSQQCKNRISPGRLRQYPEDRDATWLWLNKCNLDQIYEDDIIGLPNVTTIRLEINGIAHVDLAVFRHVPSLKALYLNNNKLRELPAFPEHSCARLTALYLYDNQLTTLHDGTFSVCTRLQILLLNNNQISHIHPDVFSSLTELIRLDLYDNKLSFIPDRMDVNNNKLRILFLNNNRLTHLPQDFASSFKRAGGGLTDFYFHDNPWRCACLLELLDDVKRAGVSDYSWYEYDGTRPVCAYRDAAPCYRHPLSGLLPPPHAVRGGGR